MVPARAGETTILDVSGNFEQRTALQGVAFGMYPVEIPARGWFRSEVVGSPALFGGPDNNNPNFHFSSQLDRISRTLPDDTEERITLFNFMTTNIEVDPITTMRQGLIPTGGSFMARILGPQKRSFTFGDFIGGEAQDFTAMGFFDPSPVADAGPNIALESEEQGNLLGFGSDVDGDGLTFSWTRLFGPNLNLSDPNVAQPMIQAPVITTATTTRMQLIVSDENSDSVGDTVDVLLYPRGGNIPPVVDAGPDGMGDFGVVVPLDGAGSFDIDGSVTLFSWTQVGGPSGFPPALLSDPTAPSLTIEQFEPAAADQVFTFQLVVSDGFDLSASDTVSVKFMGYRNNPVPLGPREALIFNAQGSVPEVTQISGDPAERLDFAGVPVPGAGRLRAEVLGSPALFGGPDGNNPAFHLSSFGLRLDGVGTLGFRQTDIETAPVITNSFLDVVSGGSKTLTVIGPEALSFTFLDFLFGRAQSFDVNVWFRPEVSVPTADAGTYPPVNSGRVVQLDGQASSSMEGVPLFYTWTQTSGPGVSLSNAGSAAPLFKAPLVTEETTLEFSLIVNNAVPSVPAIVTVTVLPPSLDSDGDGVPDDVENGAPNGGDANEDGIPDRDQGNVASLLSSTAGQYISIVSEEGTVLVDVAAIPTPSVGVPLPGFTYPIGFLRYTITGVDSGASVGVEIIVPSEIRIDSYVKFGSTADVAANHFFEFLFDGSTGARIVGNRVIVTLQDGGRGDDDLTPNGIVFDPGAPAFSGANAVRTWRSYD